MCDINTLPLLVIRGILSQLVVLDYDIKGFEENLKLLHISSKWRHLAVPLVYKTVCVGESEKDYEKRTASCKWKSNIDLVVELGLEDAVRKVEIGSVMPCIDFAKLLGPLLDILNMGSVDWPQEYGAQHIEGTIRDKAYLEDNEYLHQSLSEELMNKMLGALQNFATRFPRLCVVSVCLFYARGTAKQFTSQLVTTFSNRLIGLSLNVETNIDLEYYPPSLKYLGSEYRKSDGNSLTKILDPSRLQCWEEDWISYNCFWEDLIQVPTDGKPLVFSNLHTLSLDFVSDSASNRLLYANPGEGERKPPSKRIRLQFPQLSNLTLRKPDFDSDCLVFNPDVVPSYLHNVYLNLSLEEIDAIVKLPIKYIRHLTMYLELPRYVNNMNYFYTVTNKMLGEMGNSDGTTHVILNGNGSELDLQQLRWGNITKLQVQYLNASTLVSLLAKLPLVSYVKVGVVERDIYEMEECQHDPLIESLGIETFGGNWSIFAPVDYITDVLKQHGAIKHLMLPKDLMERMEEMIRSTISTYPHWQQISITEIPKY